MDLNEQKDRIYTLQANLWWRSFLDDPFYGHYRLKMLRGSIAASLESAIPVVPIVEKAEFLAIEDGRLPFFTCTEFGLSPKPIKVFHDQAERTALLLNYSAYSGCIHSISISRFLGFKVIKELHSIPFPKHINMSEILDYPFPEILQVEFGFTWKPPLFSERTEIARTPVQHFQNMSYRDDFIPHKSNLGRARSMLLINENLVGPPILMMSKARHFDLGFFTFNGQKFMTGGGIIPATPPIGVGQAIRTFAAGYLLLTPVDYYIAFKQRYRDQPDWEGIRLNWRQLTFEDGVKAALS